MRGILRFGALCALAATTACGEVKDTPDAPLPPDGPPDAMPDGPPIPTAVYRWVVDNQILPKTNAEARALGLDLNGDAVIDNQLGAVLVAMTSQGFAIQADTDAAISRGSILMLGEAALFAGAPAAATYTMYTGANPQPAPCTSPNDTICRRHLGGNATFSLAASSAHDPPLAGSLANGLLVAGPGHLQVSMTIFGGTPIVLDLIGARVRLQVVTDASIGQSVIGGAITIAQRDGRIYPGIHQGVSAAVAADCPTKTPPDCGCAAGSDGRTALSLFDTSPKDCTITIDEIRNNSLIQSLFAPDLTVEGQAALSFGFAVTAVKATFTP